MSGIVSGAASRPVYLYCCLSAPALVTHYIEAGGGAVTYHFELRRDISPKSPGAWNGWVVGHCLMRKARIADPRLEDPVYRPEDLAGSLVTPAEAVKYAAGKDGYAATLYSILVEDAMSDGRPVGLDDFGEEAGGALLGLAPRKIAKAPQSWRFALKAVKTRWERELADREPGIVVRCGGADYLRCIILSVRPKWLCPLMAGEKTREIRKGIWPGIEIETWERTFVKGGKAYAAEP